DGGYFRDKAYDNRPWVKYDGSMLTFRCGYKKTLGENEYALNSGEELPKWNTHNSKISKVVFEASFANARPTNCYAWFRGFENLKQIEGIENLNTANVTDMSYMFKNCSNLAELDVTHFNTAKVTTMNGMFSGCSNLTELDLTHFNTENVTNMWLMFSYCESLTTIYVSDDFVITNITYKTYSSFYGCEKLKGAIDKYDNSKIDGTYANYKTGYFTKLVGKNGDEKIGAAGEPLATDNLVLDDDKDFVAYEPFAAKAASYSRTINAGTTWATLCLPFEVSLDGQNFRAFKLLSADEGTETVELEEIETSIEAGTPVIIKMKDGATELKFTEADKEIAKDVQTAETADANYKLQGIYTQKEFSKDTDNNCYIVKGAKLMNPAKLLGTATEFVGSKPFRAYMVDNSSAPAAGARMFSISVGGSTTAIEQLETTADSKAEYYDLQGRCLQDLQKGINIVKRGGKTMKVIIK
uniref:BspA family leucine-rich repeat surface protein n=1 Tax=Prevotella sp. TaxID=59823 RepID=UPI003FEE3C16